MHSQVHKPHCHTLLQERHQPCCYNAQQRFPPAGANTDTELLVSTAWADAATGPEGVCQAWCRLAKSRTAACSDPAGDLMNAHIRLCIQTEQRSFSCLSW
jgi:hypothetical protein